jgi:hypothetical protein
MQPPSGAAEAEREAAEAQGVVEHRAHNVGGYPTTRVDEEDQGP